MKIAFIGLLISVGILQSCTPSSDPTAAETQKTITNKIFSDTVTNFKVNVIFETGATPYTGNLDLALNNTWDITRDSYLALFQSHPARSLTIPTTTNQMVQIADQAKTMWQTSELINLGNTQSAALLIGTQINITVIFLNGTYQGNTSILGVHFTGFPFVFVFKDVVTSTGGTSTDQRYVEQATVVHEIGHAVGIVNNGLPMAASHEDGAHAKHALNNRCVMYWAVESASTILSGLSGFITGQQLNLFAAESLADGRAYHP